MNYETITVAAVATLVAGMIVRAGFRREFIVAQGFAGLLYRHGQFVELLAAGRHALGPRICLRAN